MGVINVIGVGPGGRDFLTRAAEKVINQAHIIIGGRRQIALFDSLPVEKHTITADLNPVYDLIRDKARLNLNIVVLASGDPGFYGILSSLQRNLPGYKFYVIPGISSIQLACARIGVTWDDAVLISCHGRGNDFLIQAVINSPKVITLTDRKNNPHKIAQVLVDNGVNSKVVSIACNLSHQDETVVTTTLAELVKGNEWEAGNCVMVICDE